MKPLWPNGKVTCAHEVHPHARNRMLTAVQLTATVVTKNKDFLKLTYGTYNVISYTYAFPAVTSLNVIFEKGLHVDNSLVLVFSTTVSGRISVKRKYHSSLIAITKLFSCQIATLQPIPLHEHLFALTSHSHSMTSSLLLIRFAIFRALDVYSANSVNIVFLQQPSLV